MLQDFPDVNGVHDLKIKTFQSQQLSSISSQLKSRNPTVTRHNHYFVSNSTDTNGIKNNITLKMAAEYKHNHNTFQVSKRNECRKSLPYLQPTLLSLHAAASFQQFQIFPPSQLSTQ